MPRTSDIEPPDVAEHELIPEKIVEEVKPLDNVEKLIASEPAVPNGRSDGIVNEKELGKSKKPQESQINYDFGDSWSDPLDFAFKTLRGEIKLEDTLGFSGDLNDPLNSPFNEGEADPFPKPSQYDEPILFHNEFVPCSEPSKEHGTVGQLQLNSSLSLSSEIPNTLQAKSSLPSPSLNQHATIDLSLANSSVSLPSFNQHETIANSFKPHGAFAQFPANSSSAPLKQYGAVGLSQANSSFSFPYFKEYGSVGPMHANSSLFSPSFRQSGTISQWLPTNSSFDNSSLFSLSSRQPGTVGQWPPTNLSTENSSLFSSSFRQPGTVSQWPPTNPTSFSCPGNMEFSSFSSFNAQSSADATKKNNQTKFNP